MARAPSRFASALALAIRMMRGSDRPFIWHLIYLAEACWIAPRLERDGITHIHAHFGTNPAEVAMLAAALMGIGYSVTIHGPEEFDRAQGLNLGEKIRRASFVVAISSYCRSQLYRIVEQNHWGKIKVVHCGIDAAFAALDAVHPSQAERLVCVGRLCEQKGQLLLIEAAASLAREGRAFKLVLVGDGEDRGEIERLIVEHGLENHVEITGWASADRVRSEILAARALILPSFCRRSADCAYGGDESRPACAEHLCRGDTLRACRRRESGMAFSRGLEGTMRWPRCAPALMRPERS